MTEDNEVDCIRDKMTRKTDKDLLFAVCQSTDNCVLFEMKQNSGLSIFIKGQS